MIRSVDFLRRGPVRGGDGSFPGASSSTIQGIRAATSFSTTAALPSGASKRHSVNLRLSSSPPIPLITTPCSSCRSTETPRTGQAASARINSNHVASGAQHMISASRTAWHATPPSRPPCSMSAASSRSSKARRARHVRGANSAVKCRSARGSLTMRIPFKLSFRAATSAKVSTI